MDSASRCFSTACGEVILAELKPEPDRLPASEPGPAKPPNEPDRAVDPKPDIR